ncbi:MAG: TaqI-like C-terminal specificity domain-containing protein [Bdellovibrionota bacterium]
MISNVWLIPASSEKPNDERLSIELEGMLSLSDICSELSISVATGRNWVKLGKLIPTEIIKRTPYFAKGYVSQVKKEIASGKNKALKSRRNKKFISGTNIYNSYISDNSKNLSTIQSLLNVIQQNEVSIDDDIIVALIADCANQLISSKIGNGEECEKFKFLVDDLISLNPFALTAIENYPELANFTYEYESGEDILGLLYISLQNIGNRKATGSYYTPTAIVKKLCRNLFSENDSTGRSVLDPCCGTGNFILQLPDSFDSLNVYGNDIDPISVKIARINYALKYQLSNKEIIYSHITERDYLSYSTDIKFDFIIGNPPWGYVYTEREKAALRNQFKCAVGNNIESYDVFVEQALSNLHECGVLSFVLPEAFLNVKAHMPMRQLLINSNSIQYIEFLGNAFDKVQCPCIILQIEHTNAPLSTKGLKVNDGNRIFTINNERKISADYFSFTANDEEYSVISKIENVKDKVTLRDNAVFALGIVTGNNEEYISSFKNNNNEMILKGSDLRKYRFNETENYIVFLPESFQQIAPTEYYRAEEKLLYRFICNQLVFAYDNHQTLSLNSCNILIPQIPSLDIKYIMAILNSRMAQFYFKKQFSSVKILRSHIEQIPIPQVDKKTQSQIIALVDLLLCTSLENDIVELYEIIDSTIANLFKLSNAEYQLVKQSMEGENLFLV